MVNYAYQLKTISNYLRKMAFPHNDKLVDEFNAIIDDYQTFYNQNHYDYCSQIIANCDAFLNDIFSLLYFNKMDINQYNDSALQMYNMILELKELSYWCGEYYNFEKNGLYNEFVKKLEYYIEHQAEEKEHARNTLSKKLDTVDYKYKIKEKKALINAKKTTLEEWMYNYEKYPILTDFRAAKTCFVNESEAFLNKLNLGDVFKELDGKLKDPSSSNTDVINNLLDKKQKEEVAKYQSCVEYLAFKGCTCSDKEKEGLDKLDNRLVKCQKDLINVAQYGFAIESYNIKLSLRSLVKVRINKKFINKILSWLANLITKLINLISHDDQKKKDYITTYYANKILREDSVIDDSINQTITQLYEYFIRVITFFYDMTNEIFVMLNEKNSNNMLNVTQQLAYILDILANINSDKEE